MASPIIGMFSPAARDGVLHLSKSVVLAAPVAELRLRVSHSGSSTPTRPPLSTRSEGAAFSSPRLTTTDEIVTAAFVALQRPAEDNAIFLAVFPRLEACLDRLRHSDVSRLLPPRPSVPAPILAPSTVLPGEAQHPAVPIDDRCPRDGSQHGAVVPTPPLTFSDVEEIVRQVVADYSKKHAPLALGLKVDPSESQIIIKWPSADAIAAGNLSS